METKLSRSTIRNLIFSRMGIDTAGGQDPQTLTQCNALIDQAALDVGEKCKWQTAMTETRVTVGIDQRVINYPTNTGPQEIVSLAVWDADKREYFILKRWPISLKLDDDPDQDAGEPDSIDNRGQPCIFELKDQIEIWPRPDQSYEIKIDHTRNTTFADDNAMSIVDSECIILYVMSEMYQFQGDDRLSDKFMMKYERRIYELISGAQPLSSFQRGGRSLVDRYKTRHADDWDLNSGRWPSEVPSP